MTILLIILGLLILLIGVAGCIVPVIPGPGLALTALVVLCLAKGWGIFSVTFWIIMVLLLILVTVADYYAPLLGAKKYGATKLAMIGGVIGMIAGIFIFPPFGVFIGAFVGAVIGEAITGADGKKALAVGWGVFVGSMASIGIQLAYCMLALFFYVKGVFFL